MLIFDRLGGEYEQVVFCHDADVNLRAVIAIHSTVLGPALGGTRFYPYADENDALEDVLRLARGMTYKASVAGLNLGGGKAVIFGDPNKIRSDDLLRAYASFVHSLAGRYITAEDVGTTMADMDIIRTVTKHVTGVSPELGGSGDPSPATAFGVFQAMTAVAEHRWGTDDLGGKHIVITGVGKVGFALGERLKNAGARLTVADVNDAALRRAIDELGAETVPVSDAHTVECDIFSPCALGGTLTTETVSQLRCAAVVGSANNQLASAEVGNDLKNRDIVYGPDYIVNAGGLISVADEIQGYDRERVFDRITGIHDITMSILQTADRMKISTADAADHLAEERLAAASVNGVRSFHRPPVVPAP